MATRTVYRSSGDGKFITKREFDNRPPNTVEREKIRVPAPQSSPSRKK